MSTYRSSDRAVQDWLDQAERFDRFARQANNPHLRANFARMAADARHAAAELDGSSRARESFHLPSAGNDL
jgi:hypothetical protein